jgi:hypothetical protein
MKVGQGIEEVQIAEAALAKELLRVGERYAADHDVYHVCHTLAKGCEKQLALLVPHAERYRVDREQHVGEPSAVVERVRRIGSELLGRQSVSGSLLLHDLKELYAHMQHVELEWVVLVQAAKAARDTELKTAAEDGREHAETRGKWVRGRIKELAPQILVAG